MRLAHFKVRLLRFFAERLRNWSASVQEWAIEAQQQPPDESADGPDGNLELPAGDSGPYSNPPTAWARLRKPGPPPHWVELVKQRAPELLSPLQDDLVPPQTAEDPLEEGHSEADGDLKADSLPPESRKAVAHKPKSQPSFKNRASKNRAKGRSRPGRLPFKFLRSASETAKPSEPASDQEGEHSMIPELVEPSEQETRTESPSVALLEAPRPGSGARDHKIRSPQDKRLARPAAKRESHRALAIERNNRTSLSGTAAPQPRPELDVQRIPRSTTAAPNFVEGGEPAGPPRGKAASGPVNSSLKDFSRRTDSAARAIVTEETGRPAVSAADAGSSSHVLQKTSENPSPSESIRATRLLRMRETASPPDSISDIDLPITDEPARESGLSPARPARSVNQSRRFFQPRLQPSAVNLPSLMDEETMNEATSVSAATPKSGENPWPDLPSAPALKIGDEVAARERQMERLQRLEREQRGTLWNA